jgi:acyl carrier protein
MSDAGKSIGELSDWLANLIAEIADKAPSEIDRTARFDRFGLDSVAIVGVSAALEDYLGKEIDATVLYDFPTIEKLSAKLCESSGAK